MIVEAWHAKATAEVASLLGSDVASGVARDEAAVHLGTDWTQRAAQPADPGVWMAHCHVLEHAEAGMMTLVEVR